MSVGKGNEGVRAAVSALRSNMRARARARPVKNILSRNIRAWIGGALRGFLQEFS